MEYRSVSSNDKRSFIGIIFVDDRFRCFIDDTWWPGTVVKREPFDNRHENSPFQCYIIRWDNGESEERLSPWDMFPCEDSRTFNYDFSFDIQQQSHLFSVEDFDDSSMLKLPAYEPTPDEWPTHGMDIERERLLKALDTLMKMDASEQFRSPGNK